MGVETIFIGMTHGGEACAVDWSRPADLERIKSDPAASVLEYTKPDSLSTCAKNLLCTYVEGYEPVLCVGKFFAYVGTSTSAALDEFCKLLVPAEGQSKTPGALYLCEDMMMLLKFDTVVKKCLLWEASLKHYEPLKRHYRHIETEDRMKEEEEEKAHEDEEEEEEEEGDEEEDQDQGERAIDLALEDERDRRLLEIVRAAFEAVPLSPASFVSVHDALDTLLLHCGTRS